ELLLAGEIEVGELADGRHVTQDAEKIQLALLRHRDAETFPEPETALSHLAGVGIVRGRARRLPHLLLDLLQEFFDAGCRRYRLCALDPDDRALGLAVGKVQLDQARRHQHAADQDEEDDDVLAEEAAARIRAGHRRNASARRRIFLGTVSPRSSAVFKFTARSIFSAPSTGRS